jgi:hypothetical protein
VNFRLLCLRDNSPKQQKRSDYCKRDALWICDTSPLLGTGSKCPIVRPKIQNSGVGFFFHVFQNHSISADDSIGSGQDVRRDRQADLLRGLEIDHQFELGGLLDGKVGGLCAFENFIHVSRGAVE